jgi:hypothetical protein
MLKPRHALLPLILFVAMVGHSSVAAQNRKPVNNRKAGSGAEATEWRHSAAQFSKQVEQFRKDAKGEKQFPQSSYDLMAKGGEVPNTWEVMRLYSGEVEWEGTFQGFEKDGKIDGREDKLKITGPVGMMMHVYPSADALKQWKALRKPSKVRYRATIEGIAGFTVPGSKDTLLIVSLKDAEPAPKK